MRLTICRKLLPWKLVFHSRRCQIILLSYIQYRRSRIFNIRARNALPRRIEQDCTDRRIREISQHLFDGEFSPILALFNHLICPLKHAAWNCQTDLSCRFQVDDELKLRRLLHRKISQLGAFEFKPGFRSREIRGKKLGTVREVRWG